MNRLMSMSVGVLVCAAVAAACVQGTVGQGQEQAYKLGTFSESGRTFVGLVLEDTLVVDLDRANNEIAGTRAGLPSDLKELIAQYDEGGLASRLQAIASAASEARNRRPAYLYDVASVKVLPPLMPTTILNAAVNYVEHAEEMSGRGGAPAAPGGGGGRGGAQPGAAAPPAARPLASMPGLWERRPDDTRQNPYLFVKPVSAVIGNGDAIHIPPARDRVDWECELDAVIGRTASHVSPDQAADYIFGYTLQNDVSDRGGRGDNRHGSDWLIGKGHDTFAPIGPFIVPKAFVPDPQALPITFTLSGTVMQDSNTNRMTHSVFEMVSYASHILTLRPGDLVSTGSPAGVGTARATPIYMKPGDVSVCTIGGIGTLTNPVVGSPALTN